MEVGVDNSSRHLGASYGDDGEVIIYIVYWGQERGDVMGLRERGWRGLGKGLGALMSIVKYPAW